MKKHITSLISQQFGRFASHEFSPWFQNIVNSGYVNIMGLDMSEFHAPSTYKTLNQLFTRKMRESRKFSLDSDDFISPCDSLITQFGDLDDTKALQIKGMSYCVNELLGDKIDDEAKERLQHGQFVNFYLSPKDYHRYHIPTNMKVLKAVHIPGKLYPVNMPSLNKRVDLFIENERVVVECETQQGKLLYMVLVGALNVGKMQVGFEPRIKTNADAFHPQSYSYDELYLDKGDDFGCFEMGSTIVIIAEKEMFQFDVELNEKVSFGQTIAKLR
ncbi:MAG: phosphatidylserine decarboxylase [Campylobacterota bacterium]|nr:phosphatidylserine decarboxylase [Campylobacterota bacterium]